jgi:predicted outer membrane protein
MMLGGRRWARCLFVVAVIGGPTIVGAAPALAGAPAPVAPDANGKLPAGWTDTQWGPLGPVDRSLLENVRRANLWEGDVASVLGMEKGTTQEVKDAGKEMNRGHAQLEKNLRPIASKLNVPLPSEPNADQKDWIRQMEAANGTGFDKVWVDLLRAAHGKIFSVIASVRANTRNSLIREYAEQANEAVKTHMQVLEKTNLVDYNMLPVPDGGAPPAKPAAAGADQAANSGSVIDKLNPASSTSGGLSPLVIWALLIVAFGAAGAALFRVIRVR